MKQIGSIWILLIGSLIAFVFSPTLSLTQTSQDQMEDEEYEVSSAALEHFRAAFLDKSHLIVISAVTVADGRLQAEVDRIWHSEPVRRNAEEPALTRHVDPAKRAEARKRIEEWNKTTLQNPKAFAEEISDQAILDWTRKNYDASTLSNKFHVQVPMVILSESDVDRLRPAKGHRTRNDAWTAFRRKYPEAGGTTLTISRVGFNAPHTQAVIEVGCTTGPEGGEVHYMLLAKANGVWRIRYLLTAWIS